MKFAVSWKLPLLITPNPKQLLHGTIHYETWKFRSYAKTQENSKFGVVVNYSLEICKWEDENVESVLSNIHVPGGLDTMIFRQP